MFDRSDRRSSPLEVAVIGAGVSGLYCGWRLLEHFGTTPGRISIFEASPRVGGRLLSVQPPGLGGLHLELGGMRYTTVHRHVRGLVEAFGLESLPFPVQESQNLAYLRGHRLRRWELTDPAKIPYRIPPEDLRGLEIGFTALAAERYLRSSMSLGDIDLETIDWVRVAREGRYNGHAVTDLAMRFVYERSVSGEAKRFSEDSSGYATIYHGSAAAGFPWNLRDYQASVQFRRLAQGFCSLTRALRDRFVAAGGTVHLESRLVGFDVESDATGEPVVAFEVERDGVRTIHHARQLILAMPRRSLELLAARGPLFDPAVAEVRSLIRSVTPRPLFKLVLCYARRWWEATGVHQGQSVTDLPLRQVYYWPAPAPNPGGALMIYNDGASLEYWESLCRHDERFPQSFHHHAGESSEREECVDWKAHPAPKIMVEEAHRQLLEMHGIEDLPEHRPYAAAHREWDLDPFGGGSNYWNEFVDAHTVGAAMLQPRPGAPVYVCGEAYSNEQGWVEGALEVAESLMQRHFGLPEASFLSRGGAADSASAAPSPGSDS